MGIIEEQTRFKASSYDYIDKAYTNLLIVTWVL